MQMRSFAPSYLLTFARFHACLSFRQHGFGRSPCAWSQIMKSIYTLPALLVAVVALSTNLRADTVKLANGDQLSGSGSSGEKSIISNGYECLT